MPPGNGIRSHLLGPPFILKVMDDHDLVIVLPSGYFNIAIEDGPVEIVSFPIHSMVILTIVNYVNVYQRVKHMKPIMVTWGSPMT